MTYATIARNRRPPLRSATDDWAGTLARELSALNFSMAAA